MAELVRHHADFLLGAVDASVLAVAERFGPERVATTLDRRHFSSLRPVQVEALTLDRRHFSSLRPVQVEALTLLP